jgi:RNA-directed DNA polymerase
MSEKEKFESKFSEYVEESLSGLKIAITGKLNNFTRKEVAVLINRLGGSFQKDISRSTNILVIGTKSTITKVDKARTIGSIEIMSEIDFINLIMKDQINSADFLYTYFFKTKSGYKRNTRKINKSLDVFLDHLNYNYKYKRMNYKFYNLDSTSHSFHHSYTIKSKGSVYINICYDLTKINDRFVFDFEQFMENNNTFLINPKSYYLPVKKIKKKRKISKNGKLQNLYRTILEPKKSLKDYQRLVKNYLENEYGLIPHFSSLAYFRGTSVVINASLHKKSRYFLRLDIKDFFGSINPSFLNNQLKKLYQFTTIDNKSKQHEEVFYYKWHVENKTYRFNSNDVFMFDSKKHVTPTMEKVLKIINIIAFYDNFLPQGSPLSPTLSNLVMLPLDFEINNYCKTVTDKKPYITYTRYSDDLIFSSQKYFDYKTVINKIEEYFTNTPFKINYKKIVFKKNTQRLFITGVKINKENQISYGHLRKAQLKREIFKTFISLSKNELNVSENRKILGKVAFAKSIDRIGVENIINKYSKKFGIPPSQFNKYFLTGIIN